jgi:hypothetical protein
MRSDKLNVNSANYGDLSDDQLTQLTPEIIFQYNYITCANPVVSVIGNASNGVLATEDRFGMLFFGPNNEIYPASCMTIGAVTAAGKLPQVDGAVPATDTATTVAGFDIQMDCESNADTGLEMVLSGSPLGGNANGFTIGTHRGYIDATFLTADWTDFDGVGVGFRKVEDFNDGHVPILHAGAAADGVYTDFAAFGAMGDTNIQTMTDLNDSGTSITTNVGVVPVDGQNMRVKIYLDGTGNVTYSHVNNAVAGAGTLAEPSGTVAYVFDDGDVVIPYLYTSNDTAAADELMLKDVTVVRAPGISYSGDGSI